MLERDVPPNIDSYVLRYWYIYIGVLLRNPREGGYAGAGGQTARDDGAKETLKP
jgi:hypothetical protein